MKINLVVALALAAIAGVCLLAMPPAATPTPTLAVPEDAEEEVVAFMPPPPAEPMYFAPALDDLVATIPPAEATRPPRADVRVRIALPPAQPEPCPPGARSCPVPGGSPYENEYQPRLLPK